MTDIKLIQIEEHHLELIRNWRNSPEVAAYMYTNKEISIEDQKNWYNKIKNETSSKYWIIEFDGKPLGVASISDINTTLSSCFWAFYLGDNSVRGAGIGSKVEYRVLHFVFEELKLNKLRCEVFNFNQAVIKMHEKYGFRREAYYREHCIKDGKPEDVVGLAILKKEWDKLKEGMYQSIYNKEVQHNEYRRKNNWNG